MNDKILLAHLQHMKLISTGLHARFLEEVEGCLGNALDFSLCYIDYSIERLEDLVRGTESSDDSVDMYFREMESRVLE